MNTEITDHLNTTKPPCVCYDADCALCVRWARRAGASLEKHGFVLLPLQSAAVRAALRLAEDDLLAEMRVITTDGRVFGGADAVVYLSQFVCKPLSMLARIPGAKGLLRVGYRLLARNRNCRAGACRTGTMFRVASPGGWLPLPIKPGGRQAPAENRRRYNQQRRRHHGPTTFFDMP